MKKKKVGSLVKKGKVIYGTNYYQPQWVSPELSELALMRPPEGASLNKILRWYYVNDPIVHNIIDLHSTYPVSKFTLSGVSDPFIEKFYLDVLDELNIMRLMCDIFKEYTLIGEVIPYGVWDGYEGKFTNITLLDPDDVDIKSHPLLGVEHSLVYLREMTNIKRMAEEDENFASVLEKRVDKKLYEAIMDEEPFLIPDFNVAHIANFSSPKSVRGTGLVHSVLNLLFYKTKLEKALIAAADRFINPTTIYVLSPTLENTEITQRDIDEFTELIEAARRGQVSEIVYWQKVDVKQNNSKLPSLASEFNRVNDEIMIGLLVNKSIISANGPTWNAASIAKRILISRYMLMRDLIEDYLREKVFKPIAEAQMFYEVDKVAVNNGWVLSPKYGRRKIDLRKLRIKKGELKIGGIVKYNGVTYKVDDINRDEGWVVLSSNDARKLVIPKFNWRGKIDLTEDDKLISFITSHYDKGEIPFQLVADLFDLDVDYVRDMIIKEKGSVFDYIYRKSQDKVANDSKSAPDNYNAIMDKALDNYYKIHPDEKPEGYDEKKKQEEQEKQGVLNLADEKFNKDYVIDEKLALIGYGKAFVNLYNRFKEGKINKEVAIRRISELFNVAPDLDYEGDVLDYYWNLKFNFWKDLKVDKVYKIDLEGDDLGEAVDISNGYVDGMIKDLKEGFVDNIRVNTMTKNGVNVVDIPLYMKFYIEGVEAKEGIKHIIFTDTDEEAGGVVMVNVNRSGKELKKYIEERIKK